MQVNKAQDLLHRAQDKACKCEIGWWVKLRKRQKNKRKTICKMDLHSSVAGVETVG